MKATLHIALVVIFLLPTVFVGCSERGTTEPGATERTTEEGMLQSTVPSGPVAPPTDPPASQSFVLPNGLVVQLDGMRVIGDSIVVNYSYTSATGNQRRIMKIHLSLLGMTFYDIKGIQLGGHEFISNEKEVAEYHVWAGSDRFIMSADMREGSVNLVASDGRSFTAISFASAQEYHEVAALIEQKALGGSDLDLSNNELSRLSSVDDWSVAVGQYSAFTAGNEELQTAEYLLADGGFLALITTDYGGEMPSYLLKEICAVADLIFAACTFFWSWCAPCWIICVPAAGISLACSLADLAN